MNYLVEKNPHRYLVLGTSGRLGMQLASRLGASQALILPQPTIRSMVSHCDFRVLRELQTSHSLTVFNAIGLTNSETDLETLNAVNVKFPFELGEFLLSQGSKLFTFGSILENEPLLSSTNKYLASKREFFEKFTSRDDFLTHFAHIQLHTLYGSADPHAHMFLGQIIQSIRQKKKFAMTSGLQIRQYHQIAEIADSILNIEKHDIKGVVQLNGKVGLRLIDIARNIYAHFNHMDLLQVHQDFAPKHEIYSNSYEYNSRLWRSTPHEGLLPILTYVCSLIESNSGSRHT